MATGAAAEMEAVDFEPEDDDLMDEDTAGDPSPMGPPVPKLRSTITGGDAAKRIKGRGFREAEAEAERKRRLASSNFDSLSSDGGPGPQRSIEGWIVLATGVHEEAQEDDLHNAFREYGQVKNLHVNLDRRTGFVKDNQTKELIGGGKMANGLYYLDVPPSVFAAVSVICWHQRIGHSPLSKLITMLPGLSLNNFTRRVMHLLNMRTLMKQKLQLQHLMELSFSRRPSMLTGHLAMGHSSVETREDHLVLIAQGVLQGEDSEVITCCPHHHPEI